MQCCILKSLMPQWLRRLETRFKNNRLIRDFRDITNFQYPSCNVKLSIYTTSILDEVSLKLINNSSEENHVY